ncbi:MAG: cation:proton antiporter [Oscillospiraceae bacterium]|jgi:NhaP-type Na+/H+ or K+/H+ antiporter|nr:cation:proton antiporter [Oscillospiraceae bacterium]
MLTSLALIFLCGLLLGSIFQKLKMPSLIGMLIIGIVLGPYVLNLLDASILNISADLRQLALIIILTQAGLSLDLHDLKKVGRPAVLLSLIPAFFEMGGTILFGIYLFKLPVLDAAILAAVIASASPAVITPRMLKLMETGYGTNKQIPQMIMAGDSVDDITNIVIFTSLLGLAAGTGVSAVRFALIPVSAILGIALGVLLGFILSAVFKKFHMRDSVKIIVILSVAFLFITLEEFADKYLPFSGLLSVMTMGAIILLRRPVVAERISTKFSKLWVGAEILLFVLVGSSMNIGYASAAILKTVVMLVAVLLIRAAGILLCLIKTNLNRKERLFCTFAGIPKATVQAAIGGIPLAMGLPNGDIILTVAVLSILFTAPLGAFILDKTYRHLLTNTSAQTKSMGGNTN